MRPKLVSGQGKPGSASSGIARHWVIAVLAAIALLVVIGVVSLVVYMGAYSVAADIPHTQPVFWLMNTVRERSIAVHAADVVVPDDLGDSSRVVSGAGQYAEMCAGCHLAPGMKRTEIARGLYPRAPALRRGTDLTPAEEF